MKGIYGTCQQRETQFVEEARGRTLGQSETSSQWKLLSMFKIYHVSKHITEMWKNVKVMPFYSHRTILTPLFSL